MAPGQIITWVDGVKTSALPLPDRGLDFGDGLFETLLLVEGRPLYLDLHLQRLKAGMAALGFPVCDKEVRSQVTSILQSCEFPGEAAMRVTVTRGGGPRGYAIPEPSEPRIIVSLSGMPNHNFRVMQPPAHLSLASTRLGEQPKLAGIKHLNRLEQVLAASERQLSGSDELVMLDIREHVVSVCAGNLFIMYEGSLLTPILDNCGVHGTRRRLVLDRFGPEMGLPVFEKDLGLAQLEAASEVFYCNALTGFRPVAAFAERQWSDHRICTALHQRYCEEAC